LLLDRRLSLPGTRDLTFHLRDATTFSTTTTMIIRTFARAIAPRSRLSYIAFHRIGRHAFSARSSYQSSYHRSDFSGQGFSNFYEPDQPTRGPLGGTSSVGHSCITPKALKQHLDQFVVDQDRAKVVLSVAVHEHYLRNQENERQRKEQARLEAQAQRRASAFSRHPVEGSSQSHLVATPPRTCFFVSERD
jgi:ATP-dependent Clp protease ATP-binding subunit ClpX